MIPSVFVALDAIPLTSTGKADLRKLPEPEIEKETSDSGGAPEPCTMDEQRIIAMFRSVLGRTVIGRSDNFFALGGDSLASFRLVGLARRMGYPFLTVPHVMQYPTPASLTHFLLGVIERSKGLESESQAQMIEPDQEVPVQSVNLTPIQLNFFKQNFSVSNHYNQCMLLALRDDVKTDILHQSLLKMIEHHDALRLTFDSEGVQYQNPVSEAKRMLKFRSVSLAADETFHANMLELATETQTTLDISEGPLFNAVLVHREGKMRLPPVLFMVIHHLVIDVVSWGILSEDLESVYEQLTQSQTAVLPPKTHSFAQWSQVLTEYSSAHSLLEELSYWEKAERSSFVLPCNTKYTGTQLGAFEQVQVSFQSAEIGKLMNTPHVEMVVIAALAASLGTWSGCSEVCINMEGHGRESVVNEMIDLSRTIGWFTSVYPLRLELSPTGDAASKLHAILRQLRSLPNKGIGYGVLKYLSTSPAVQSTLYNTLPSQVCFNYLGSHKEAVADAKHEVGSRLDNVPLLFGSIKC